MEKLKKHYDRVLLIVIGLITLVACSMLIMKSFAIGENFQGVDPGDGKKTTPAPIEQVTQASGLFETKPEWKQPKAADSDKVYRLFASIPIVQKVDVEATFDLYDESRPLREGVSNKYLLDYKLPYSRNDVLTLDMDNDGFTVLEEFLGGATDPLNKDDYPDATNKLMLTEVKTSPFVIIFASAGNNQYSIKRTVMPGQPPLPREERWPTTWASVDDTFPESGPDQGRFKLVGFEEKLWVNPKTNRETPNHPTLSVQDTKTGETVDLPKGAYVDLPVYGAMFAYDGPGKINPDLSKEFRNGDTLKIEGPQIALKILKVSPTEVEIESTPEGKNPKIIKKALKTP